MKVTWGDPNDRYFHHGVDRGVLYAATTVAWNGITGLTEAGNGAATMYYIDGQVYLADVDPTDFSGSLTAYSFPNEFGRCVGMPEVAEGLVADNQKPQQFGLSYRSLVGSGLEGDMFGYQIHLLYKAMASIGSRERKTINNSPQPIEFTFDIVATPVKMPGLRPTAHYVIDTRHLDPDTIRDLEDMLYGTATTEGALPDPTTLFEMLNFGPDINLVDHSSEGAMLHTQNFTGSRTNIKMIDATHARIDNVNATVGVGGIVTVSDGGNTHVSSS